MPPSGDDAPETGLMRSALFVPGDSEKKLLKGLSTDADCLFIDLEDSVALANKESARVVTAQFLQSALSEIKRPLLYVRVNDFDTQMTEADLAAVVQAGAEGIVLPKSGNGRDVTELDARLRVHEAQNGIEDGQLKIIAIVTETAAATLATGTYHRASPRLEAMTWGAEDLAADIGALERRNPDGTYRDVFRFARVQTLLGAVSAGVQAMDTVYPDFRDEEGFRRECEEAAIDGFTGKMAIHPAQVSIINEVFTPSQSALEKAQAIVDAFAAAGNPGVLAVDGAMLDRPHLRKAENLLARAKLL